MPFIKGKSGNASGRKRGVKNRSSLEIRQALIDILNNNLERLQTSLASMEDKEAARLIIQLGKHLTYPEVSPERLTESQLLQIITYLKEHEKQS